MKTLTRVLLGVAAVISFALAIWPRSGPVGMCGVGSWDAALRKLPSIETHPAERARQLRQLRIWAQGLSDACQKANTINWIEFYEKQGDEIAICEQYLRKYETPPGAAAERTQRP